MQGSHSDQSPRTVALSRALMATVAPSDVRVLVVDNKEQNLVAFSAVIDQPGVTIICAQSGEQALGHVLRENFAVILTGREHARPGRVRDGRVDPAAKSVG